MTQELSTVVPGAVQDRDQWICWREEQRDEKPTKVPVHPETGGYASTTDAETWTSFETAHAAVDRIDADGVGFVFADDDDLVGVDLDDCRDPDTGGADDWADDVIDELDSYTEVSPSGTGYHVLLEGTLPEGRNRSGEIEMYDAARFFTVSGEHVSGTPETVEQRQAELEAAHAEYVQPDAETVPDREQPSGSDQNRDAQPVVDIPDDELLARAKAAKNGHNFARLWNGRTTGYDSHSEADMALCCHLAFWTGGDTARMDRLFRQSGLMREKWDEVHYADGSTYGEKTVERAAQRTTDHYEPSPTENDVVSGGDQSDQQRVANQEPPVSTQSSRELENLSRRLAAVETTVEHLETLVSSLEAEIETLQSHHSEDNTPIGDDSGANPDQRDSSRVSSLLPW